MENLRKRTVRTRVGLGLRAALTGRRDRHRIGSCLAAGTSLCFLIPAPGRAQTRPAASVPEVASGANQWQPIHWAGTGGWFISTVVLGCAAVAGAPARRLRRPRSLLAEGSHGRVRVVGIGLSSKEGVESEAGARPLFTKERHWRYTGNRWQFLGEQWEAETFWVEDRAGAVKVNGAECWFTGIRPDLIYNGAPGEGWRPVPRLGDTRVMRWSIPEGQTLTATGYFEPHPPRMDVGPDGAPVLVLTSESRARVLRRGRGAALIQWIAWLVIGFAVRVWSA